MKKYNLVFWGSSEFSVICLEELKNKDIFPDLIITTADKVAGRGLKLSANPVKIWAEKNKIKYLNPLKLDADFIKEITKYKSHIFLVASFGKIITEEIIKIPENGILNIHPSLLPKYRGASPLQEQILNNEKNIGVTIMQIDKQMDHGPVIYQEKITIKDWPIKFSDFEEIMAQKGIEIFDKILPDYLNKKIISQEQNHTEATFTKKIKKEDGLIDIEKGDPYQNFLKIQAFNVWPQTYFFISKGSQKIRVIIKEAKYIDNKLEIIKVLPEGKKEMLYVDFLRGLN